LTLCSCENISVRDFGVNDIVNIVDAIIKRDTDETPAGETYEVEIGEDLTDSSGNPIEPIQNHTDPGYIETPGLSSEDMADISDTTDVSSTEPPTEPPTQPPAAAPAETGGAFIASSGELVDVKTVFSEIPDKFKDIPFTDSLHMTDALKRNIRTLSNFSSKDLGGMSFYIGTTDAMLFTPKEYGGGMVNDARRYRTKLVDTECNAIVMSIEKPKNTILDEIQKNINAGEYFSDIICVPFDIQSELVKKGLLINLNKIPFLNLKADYYNASATDALTVNGNIYGVVSDLTFEPSNIYAVFYNKALVKNYNISNPLDIYKKGAWTYDSMMSVSKELTASIADLDDDLRWSVGFDKDNNDILNGLFISTGNKYFTNRAYDFPALNFANEKTLRLTDILSKIFAPSSESGMENYLTFDEWNQNKAFSNGNVLFSILKLDVIPTISDIDFDWGILPVPKLNQDENYYSFTGRDSMCISILKGTRNTEACGIITNALSLASYRHLQETYVREQMMYRLRDVDSVKALDEIVSGVTFNQYSTFSTMPEFYVSTVGILKDTANKKGDFADLYVNNRKILYDFFGITRIFDRE
jgi:maltose-binding protein MalE